MSRYLLFVLLVTGVALADQKPKFELSAAAAGTQVQSEAAAGQAEEAQAKTTKVQKPTEAVEVKSEASPERAPAKTKAGQERTPETQAKVEVPPAQTDAAPAQTDKDGKLISVPGSKALGMSVLGNQEAPTSLARHLADARRFQAACRQGSIHAGAALLRDPIGTEAMKRPSRITY